MGRLFLGVLLSVMVAVCKSSVTLELKADPDSYEVGLTKEIKITCTAKVTVNHTDPDGMNILNALIISFDNLNKTLSPPPTGTDLLSVFDSKVTELPAFKDYHGTSHDGKTDSTGESMLTMTLSNVNESHVGQYFCKAVGLSDYFTPVESVKNVTITKETPTTSTSVSHIVDIEKQLKNLTTQFSGSGNRWVHVDLNPIFMEFKIAAPTTPTTTTTATTTAATTTSVNSNMTSGSSVSTTPSTTTTSTTTTTTIPTTTPPPSNITSRYLLSKASMGNAYMCQFVCFVQGGYLAEVNHQEEFEFIHDFLSQELKGTSDLNVWLGTSEVGHVDKWQHMFNVNDTVNLVWGSFQAVSQNCVAMTSRTGFRMDDLDCEAEVGRALCEIPQNK